MLRYLLTYLGLFLSPCTYGRYVKKEKAELCLYCTKGLGDT